MEIRVCFCCLLGTFAEGQDSWTWFFWIPCFSQSPDLCGTESRTVTEWDVREFWGGKSSLSVSKGICFRRTPRQMHWQPSADQKGQSRVPKLDPGSCPLVEGDAGLRRVSALPVKTGIPPVTMYPQGRHPVSATLSHSPTSWTNGTDGVTGCKRDISSGFQSHVRNLKSQLIESCVGGIKRNVCLY